MPCKGDIVVLQDSQKLKKLDKIESLDGNMAEVSTLIKSTLTLRWFHVSRLRLIYRPDCAFEDD